jgi:hypothetical protein
LLVANNKVYNVKPDQDIQGAPNKLTLSHLNPINPLAAHHPNRLQDFRNKQPNIKETTKNIASQLRYDLTHILPTKQHNCAMLSFDF